MLLMLLGALWVLLNAGVLPEPVAAALWPVVGLACSIAWPLFFLGLYVAPGLFQDLTNEVHHFWYRFRTRRHEIEELERKIAHLDKPHHMLQLGNVYLSQGRTSQAARLFEQALDKDSELLDAQYKLALCRFAQGNYQEASERLEAVNGRKPEHDYGMAYLRLAQAHDRLDHRERAAEVYATLLRFYPGHAEGTYHYALLLARENDLEQARRLMREVVFSVRHSPGFQRRRNRHWLLRARWWLSRH